MLIGHTQFMGVISVLIDPLPVQTAMLFGFPVTGKVDTGIVDGYPVIGSAVLQLIANTVADR